MKITISVTEFLRVCKAIKLRPERIFKLMRSEIRSTVGKYLNEVMKAELSDYLGRQPYERKEGDGNHRNGFYHRGLTLKGIGSVDLSVPRDRKGKFRSLVIPRSKRMEEELRKDIERSKEEWISLRASNIIERLNKEFKRRTKPMEIVAGERACYTLLAFISLKMEVHWRNFLLGRRTSNLPVLQTLAESNFTQLS